MLRIFAILSFGLAAHFLSAQYGTLDPTFGDGGLVHTQLNQRFHSGYDLALQPDGKILVAGVATDSHSRLAVYRYLPNGDLDATFGDNGVAILSSPHYSSWGSLLDLQPDGKIVVAGMATMEYQGREDLALVRFLPSGQPDPSFGNNGLVTVNVWGPRETPLRLEVQADGHITVVGFAYDTQYFTHTLLARFRPNGALDTSFGDGGLLFPPFIESLGAYATNAVLHNDKILIGLGFWAGAQDYTLARLHLDGTPDVSFGNGGLAIHDFGNTERITTIVVQPDGKIVVAGDSEGPIPTVSIARLLPDGRVDAEFGNGGQTRVEYDYLSCDPGELALQADGKILVSVIVALGDSDDFGLVRLLPDGSYDPTFGEEGKVRTTFNDESYDYAFSVVVQPDHKIILSGYTTTGSDYGVALARYRSNYEPPPADTNALQAFMRIYPNPTEGDATLEFWLGKETDVALDLYDAQGRLVQNLWRPETRVAGTYAVPLALGDFVAAGTYFLALERNGDRRYLSVVKL